MPPPHRNRPKILISLQTEHSVEDRRIDPLLVLEPEIHFPITMFKIRATDLRWGRTESTANDTTAVSSDPVI